MARSGAASPASDPPGYMDADLDILATALYVRANDPAVGEGRAAPS